MAPPVEWHRRPNGTTVDHSPLLLATNASCVRLVGLYLLQSQLTTISAHVVRLCRQLYNLLAQQGKDSPQLERSGAWFKSSTTYNEYTARVCVVYVRACVRASVRACVRACVLMLTIRYCACAMNLGTGLFLWRISRLACTAATIPVRYVLAR